MTRKTPLFSLLIVLSAQTIPAAAEELPPRSARRDTIRINEIMYNPPGDTDELQFVELVNPGRSDVDVSAWKFTRGFTFKFPDKTTIPAGGYLVIARNLAKFSQQYGAVISAVGDFEGRLSHRGETVQLSDATGEVIDAVEYSDRGDWPNGPDGYSSSLERISPSAASQRAENWAPSALPSTRRPAGTPGRRNDSYSPRLPPAVTAVAFSPKCPAPGEAVTVSASVAGDDRVKEVVLLYRVAQAGGETQERTIAMGRVSGDSTSGRYQAVIDGQSDRRLVRFRVRATSANGAVRVQPSENEPRWTYSYFTYSNQESARVPFGFIIHVDRTETSSGGRRMFRRAFYGAPPSASPTRANSAFIYVPAGGGDSTTFDHVPIPRRKGGYKVRFHKGQTLRGMTVINVIFESAPRFVLAEPLAYELYRLAGVPAELTEHIRLWVDGHLLGYHLVVEQPNRSFLTRNQRDDSGNLYKLLWYGSGVVGQHEKKTNTTTGHEDLVELIDNLNSRRGGDLWEYLQKQFNVDEVVNYFVVNMCISNWDGFFNNYFTYHDVNGTGKWEIYPWDEDKTWGDYDGAPRDYAFYDMPLTFGMNGAQRSGSRRSGRGFFGGFFGGGRGGENWWRPPGYFSGPLLANPQFRERFLARLKEVCRTIFTEEKMFPIIDAMEERLEPEVRVRAETHRYDPSRAVREFRGHMQSFRNQVVHRRKYILKELGE